MTNKSKLLLVFLLLTAPVAHAQVFDTLRVMHYNLLNYRNSTSFCTEQNNNSDQKDANLKIIFDYVKPDIFTVNEMGANWTNPSKILSNAINVNGESDYKQAEFASNGSSSLVNMLFFNRRKLALHSQFDITKNKDGFRLVRSIDLYRLYYKDAVALAKGDTNFILVAVAHFKAGSTSSDKSSREKEANALMDYLNDNNERINYLLCGDFNIQTSSEASYQALTNHSNANIRFYDPVDAPGAWNNKSTFANLHTQSTRTSSNGCASGGGMDDRFDFILCGNEVLMNDYWMQYIPNSYKALGQDSRRFNGSINSPSNIAVPSNVADALYNMSDHLPVIMDLNVRTQLVSNPHINTPKWSVVNPVKNVLYVESQQEIDELQIWSLQGHLLYEFEGQKGFSFQLEMPPLSEGMYLLKAKAAGDIQLVKKVILSHD